MNKRIRIRYESHRALDADHGAYLAHGGMLVPWPSAESAPALNSEVEIVIESRDGRSFCFTARVGQRLPGRGFLASFDERSRAALFALDTLVEQDAFRRALAHEGDGHVPAPRVTWEEKTAAVEGPKDRSAAGRDPEGDETDAARPFEGPREAGHPLEARKTADDGHLQDGVFHGARRDDRGLDGGTVDEGELHHGRFAGGAFGDEPEDEGGSDRDTFDHADRDDSRPHDSELDDVDCDDGDLDSSELDDADRDDGDLDDSAFQGAGRNEPGFGHNARDDAELEHGATDADGSPRETEQTGQASAADHGEDAEAIPDRFFGNAYAPSRRTRRPRAPAPRREPSEFDLDDDLTPEERALAEAAEARRRPEVGRPGPGQDYVAYSVRYEHLRDFLVLMPALDRELRFRMRFQEVEAGPGDPAELRIILPGHNLFEMWCVVADVEPEHLTLLTNESAEGLRRLRLYCGSSGARARTKNEAHMAPASPHILRTSSAMPTEDPGQIPLRRRLARMGMDDKINLALSGNREERMALALDSNRAIHFYLLKNAKITLDEVAFMARLPSLNPMVLERIAENPSYTQNLQVTKGLVYNPKTPIKTAVRLLDRLPRPEVMTIAKRTQMHPRLVMSARNKLSGKKW